MSYEGEDNNVVTGWTEQADRKRRSTHVETYAQCRSERCRTPTWSGQVQVASVNNKQANYRDKQLTTMDIGRIHGTDQILTQAIRLSYDNGGQYADVRGRHRW